MMNFNGFIETENVSNILLYMLDTYDNNQVAINFNFNMTII